MLNAYAPTMTQADLFEEGVRVLGAGSPDLLDGPEIAGLPSVTYRADVGGAVSDVYIFGDDSGTYQILLQTLKPEKVEALTSTVGPAVLETVTLGAE